MGSSKETARKTSRVELLFNEFASSDATLASAFGAAQRTLASLPELTLCEQRLVERFATHMVRVATVQTGLLEERGKKLDGKGVLRNTGLIMYVVYS